MLSRRLLRIKIVKELYSYFKSGEDSIQRSEKELNLSIRKCYELYLLFIYLMTEVADVAEERIEINRAKLMPTEEDLHPNMRFVENQLIAKIRESKALAERMKEFKISWREQRISGVIKKLYADLAAAPYYEEYMRSPKNGFQEDKQLVVDFLTNQIEDNDYFEEAMEEASMFWVDDINYSLGLAIRTIAFMNERSGDVPVMPMYKNDDDREFVETLFRKALIHHEKYFEYIDQFTQNWDFERIAFMDKLIMLAAITELLEFPSIPVKVTLDEYIEISKYYSTQGSSVFVNGILDKIVAWMNKENMIQKSGRGLLDTKNLKG